MNESRPRRIGLQESPAVSLSMVASSLDSPLQRYPLVCYKDCARMQFHVAVAYPCSAGVPVQSGLRGESELAARELFRIENGGDEP